MQGSIRTRTLTAGGGLLAATGLAAAMFAGTAAFADTTPTTANAEVESTITLTGDAAFTLAGLPGGEPATSTSALNAETNNTAGYDVTVQADQANLTPDNGALTEADAGYNGDVIPVSSLQVQDSASTLTALSDTTPVTVHTQGTKSAEGGDALTANYSLVMPFVNADTYSGGLTFTATAN